MHLLNKILICFFMVMFVGNVTTAYAKLCCCFEEQTEQAEAMPCHAMADETAEHTPADDNHSGCECMDSCATKAYEVEAIALANVVNENSHLAIDPQKLQSIPSSPHFIPPIV